MPQPLRTPDLAIQRSAMQKLRFLEGKWSGEARALRGPGEMVEMIQTEEATYKLDGLVLMIEGVGRWKSDGKLLLQALGLITFDDEAEVYRMRAFNDGRWLETEVHLLDDGQDQVTQGITWGFSLGSIQTRSILRISPDGAWTEEAEITIGDNPPRRLMDLIVRRLS